MDKNAYVLRLGHRLTTALQESVVGIGWANANELMNHKEWGAFKENLKAAYSDMYAGNERSLGNGAGSAWRFLFEMKEGDYVLVPCDEGFYIAQIASDAFYDAKGVKDDFSWKRKVVWKSAKAISRLYASNELQKRLKVRNTCASASDLMADIRDAEVAKAPVSFSTAALSGAYPGISKALKSALNDRQLEQLVCSLARAAGAKAVVLPKRGLVGDADVEAIYDLRIGGKELLSQVRVLYQVKQHQGISDAHGIQQLIDRMEAMGGEADKGCFVTTAPDISDDAQALADANGIMVVKESALIEWILSVGLDNCRDEAV